MITSFYLLILFLQKVAELWVPLCYYASALYLAVIFGGQVTIISFHAIIILELSKKIINYWIYHRYVHKYVFSPLFKGVHVHATKI